MIRSREDVKELNKTNLVAQIGIITRRLLQSAKKFFRCEYSCVLPPMPIEDSKEGVILQPRNFRDAKMLVLWSIGFK